MRGNFVIDIGRRQRIKPAPSGAGPGFLQPIGWRRRRADKILHTHDNYRWLAAAVDNEALVVFRREVHDLPELGTGDVGVDPAIDGVSSFLIN